VKSCESILMFRMIISPPSSGLKCVDSGIGNLIYVSYKEVGHETQEERAKHGHNPEQ
jgi:hypothetical protein